MNAATLILFAKFPEPGRAKTRLIPALRAEGAAQLAEAFLLDLTERLAQTLDENIACVLCFDPPDAEENFRELLEEVPGALERFSLVPQRGADLGERLANALMTANESFHGPCIFIGTDAPDLPLEQIEAATKSTAPGKAFMTFATDGGYVLLAVPASTSPKIFDNIEWSTHETAKQQVHQLAQFGIETVCTAAWSDIDEPGDLEPLLHRLNAAPQIAPRTLALLQRPRIP